MSAKSRLALLLVFIAIWGISTHQHTLVEAHLATSQWQEESLPTSPLPQATQLVTTTADSGLGSLRQALLDARSSAGADTITFNIPTSQLSGSIYIIRPLTPLPALDTGGVTIDGTTQPNSNPNGPEIFIDGSSSGTGLKIQSAGNVVRGIGIFRCTGTGIEINGIGVFSNVVTGCYLGTNADASGVQSNRVGLQITGGASGNTIGGSSATLRNIISGNINGGIIIDEVGTNANLIRNNIIGLNLTTTVALSNGDGGIIIRGGASNNVIGGTGQADGNIIGGNAGSAPGILITGTGTNSNLVQGNLIGTNGNRSDLGNGGAGVRIVGGASLNVVGGKAIGAGNVIAFNGSDGVAIGSSPTSSDTIRNTVSRNSIFSNDGLGIDLGSDGTTPNDTGDGDIGPNGLLNKPVISSVAVNGNNLIITGQLDTPDLGSVIEVFVNFSSPTNQQFLAEAALQSNRAFVATVPVPAGKFSISATATDSLGNTSEYSSAVAVNKLPDLEIQNLSLTPTTAVQGGLVSVTFSVRNDGNGDTTSTTATTIVLSADSKITGTDTVLTTLLTPVIPANTSLTQTINVTIPSTAAVGTQFIGIIADAGNVVDESSESNNTASKSLKIIAPKPDLLVSTLDLSTTTVAPGGSLTATILVTNDGADLAGASITQVRLSTNTTINSSDPLLATINTSSIPGDNSIPLTVSLTIPDNTKAGNYFIGVVLDATNAVAEDDEKNNTTTTPLTVSGQADLVVDTLRINPTSVAPSGTITVDFTIRNRGNSAAAGTTHDVVFSNDSTIQNGEDLILVSRSTGSLAPNETAAFSVSVTIPANIAAGQRFIGVIADSSNAVAESTETNNTKSAAVTILDRTPPVVTIVKPNGGEGVASGRAFLIQWTANDNVGVTSQDLRLSTDGGVTFPAQIAVGISGSLTTFLWNVPALNTTNARIQIAAKDAAGNIGMASSATNFTIAPPPRIVSVKLKSSGKLLLTYDPVNGNVVAGATVQVKTGALTETFPLSINTDTSKAKVGASTRSTPGNFTTLDLLKKGTNATLVIINPNGVASDPFPFTVP